MIALARKLFCFSLILVFAGAFQFHHTSPARAATQLSPEQIQKIIKDSEKIPATAPPIPRPTRQPGGNVYIWSPNTGYSDAVYRDGAQVLIIKSDGGMTVSSSIRQIPFAAFNRNLRVELEIKNGTESRVDINPMFVSLTELSKKPKQLTRLDPDALARSIGLNATIGAIAADAFNDSSYDKTSENLKAQGTAAWITGTALRMNTIEPATSKAGVLWFANGGPQLTLTIPLGLDVYQFSFQLTK